MIEGRSVLAVIPARGGSKTLPRKNVLPVLGRPLLAWTADEARKSAYIDRMALSSEDPEILAVGRDLGLDIPFPRPAELATDIATTDQVLLHLLERVTGYDLLVLLQVTSPLRLAADIDGCLETCVRRDAPACVSVTVPDRSPYLYRAMDQAGRLRPLLGDSCAVRRRQELPPAYVLNGAVYVARTAYYREHGSFLTPDTLGYVMPPERSLDIDTELDLAIMRLLAERRGQDQP